MAKLNNKLRKYLSVCVCVGGHINVCVYEHSQTQWKKKQQEGRMERRDSKRTDAIKAKLLCIK